MQQLNGIGGIKQTLERSSWTVYIAVVIIAQHQAKQPKGYKYPCTASCQLSIARCTTAWIGLRLTCQVTYA